MYVHQQDTNAFHLGNDDDDDALNKKVLMVSTQSAFDVEYLVEMVSEVEVYAATFEAIAKKFNRHPNARLHQDTLEKRALLYRKRVANAFFCMFTMKLLRDMKYQTTRSSRLVLKPTSWNTRKCLLKSSGIGGHLATIVS